MRIIVTGALGHIGSKLVRELPKQIPGNPEIVMIDDMLAERYCSLFNLPADGRYRFIEGDVQKIDLKPIIAGADVLVHLAAVTNAAASFNNPELVERVNFEATSLVGKICAEAKVPMIYLSTTSVYGTQANVVDENCSPEELQPQSPYASTKLRGEEFLTQLGKEAGLDFITCRFGTIFGTSVGMRFHTAVNKFCWQAVLGQPLTVWKTAYDQKRPYLSVDDGVDAICLIIKKRLYDRQIYNVVTANFTVRNIVESIQKYVSDVKVEFVETKIMNQLSYEVLCDKFKAQGFKPSGDILNGIKDTIELLRNSQTSRLR